MWASHDNPQNAWLAYQDVVNRFINEGPMVISALAAMGEMLTEAGKREALIPVLEEAARRVNRPMDMAQQFAQQSNSYQINAMLIAEYERAGRNQDAQRIRNSMGLGRKNP